MPLHRGVRIRIVVNADAGSDVDYEQLIATSSDDPVDEVVAFDDLCMLPHTSGTTGTPKGVMLTHGNVTWNVVNVLSVAEFRSDDVTIAVAPFFRTGGTGVNVLPALFKGGTVVVPETSDPDEILDLIERWHVTVGFGNPDLLEALTRSPRWDDGPFSHPRVHDRWRTCPRASHPRVCAARRDLSPGLRAFGSGTGRAVTRSAQRCAQGRLGRQAAAVRRRSYHPS